VPGLRVTIQLLPLGLESRAVQLDHLDQAVRHGDAGAPGQRA